MLRGGSKTSSLVVSLSNHEAWYDRLQRHDLVLRQAQDEVY